MAALLLGHFATQQKKKNEAVIIVMTLAIGISIYLSLVIYYYVLILCVYTAGLVKLVEQLKLEQVIMFTCWITVLMG